MTQKPEIKDGLVRDFLPKKKSSTVSPSDFAKKLAKMKERDSEMVTGIFKNLEYPASASQRGILRFSIKLYPGEQTQVYELWDGEKYTLPRGVAHHLNNNCYYTEHGYLPANMGGDQGIRHSYDKDGIMTPQGYTTQRKKHRFSFIPLDFMDDAEIRSVDIIQAQPSL